MPDFIMPDCAVTLYFYEAKAAIDGKPATPARFSYCCTNCARGWHVEADGSIHPPSRSRIIQISLNGFPSDIGVSFAGLQFSLTNDFPEADPHWTSPAALAPFGVTVATPNSYPPTTGITTGPLTLTFNADCRLFYRLGVGVGGSTTPQWDDPKIYDDGSL